MSSNRLCCEQATTRTPDKPHWSQTRRHHCVAYGDHLAAVGPVAAAVNRARVSAPVHEMMEVIALNRVVVARQQHSKVRAVEEGGARDRVPHAREADARRVLLHDAGEVVDAAVADGVVGRRERGPIAALQDHTALARARHLDIRKAEALAARNIDAVDAKVSYLRLQNKSVRPLAALVCVCVDSNGSDR